MNERHTERRRAGFTLVEMLVVICVITILIGLTASATFSARQKAYTATAHQECEQIAAAFKSYWLAKGKWPISAADWTNLDKNNMKEILGESADGVVYLALDDNQFETDGTYVDPWGNPYTIMINIDGTDRVVKPDVPSSGKYIMGKTAVYSRGPNGEDNQGKNANEGGEKLDDDIATWHK